MVHYNSYDGIFTSMEELVLEIPGMVQVKPGLYVAKKSGSVFVSNLDGTDELSEKYELLSLDQSVYEVDDGDDY
jgi:hypothetical protein